MVTKMYEELYHKKMEGRLFQLDGKDYPRYSSCRWKSDNSLKKISELEIGEEIEINRVKVKRVQ